jgi:hypothetical protein
MKNIKFYFALIACFIATAVFAIDGVETQTVSAGTTSGAANSTNAISTSTAVTLTRAQGDFRIYASVVTFAATTNGTIKFFFAPSYDGVTFDTAAQSTIKVTVTPTGAGTNNVSERFQGAGIYSLKYLRNENTCNGTFSNLTFIESHPIPHLRN